MLSGHVKFDAVSSEDTLCIVGIFHVPVVAIVVAIVIILVIIVNVAVAL